MANESVVGDATVTFFPVGNGDTSLVLLRDRTSILIDLNATAASCDEDDETCYDVRAHLLHELRRVDGAPHLDAFILSHPDQDHLRGICNAFYLGDPSLYSKKDKDGELIIPDEIWFAPRVFYAHEDLCEDAKAFKQEAERRMALWKKGSDKRKLPGNRIRVIGSTTNPDLQGLDEVRTVPGSFVNEINGNAKSDFSFFVHGPFKRNSDDKNCERNDTSIVLQARFRVGDDARASLAMFGGDAGCAIWEEIYDKSKEDTLEWDLLLAPHHCSWTFFSEGSSDEGVASETVLKFVDMHRRGAVVVSSSKPIKDDDDNPPHYIAAQRYREKVGRDRLLCTMENGDAECPEPLHFSMTAKGPVKDRYEGASEVRSSAARKNTINTPKTYG